jgi:protein-tyrosine-phosphatase
MESVLIERLSALSHPQRMGIFRLLVRRYPDQVSAGEITSALGLKSSTTSVYLSALKKVGLISQRRDGTYLFYMANLDTARDIVSGLFLDCCRGRADLCPELLSAQLPTLSDTAGSRTNVLFVCTGNSARSVIAETLLRDISGDRYNAYSAGTAAKSELNPLAVEALRSNGHNVSLLRSKSVAEFQCEGATQMDFVFTVCDQAANEDCPIWPGQPVSGHWGMPDPAKVKATLAEADQAFKQTYKALRNRIVAFSSISVGSLDSGSLQRRIDEIGQL